MTHILKSGEEINTNEKPKNLIKKEINGNDITPQIIRALIYAEEPLRLSELVKKSGIYREKLLYNIKNMIDNGLLLMVEDEGKKYYIPQPLFWNNDVLVKINDSLVPILNEINEGIDYSQVKNPNTSEPLINCLQTALSLFSFEIEEIKKEQ